MPPILRSVSVVLATLAAAAVVGAQENSDKAKLYKWLDTNGFAYLAKSRFIEYKVDWRDPKAPGQYSGYGFLIASSPAGFTVADPVQSDVKYPHTVWGRKATATFQDGDFKTWALGQCQQYEKDSTYLTYGGLGALRASALARACAVRNLPKLEERFLNLASGVRDYYVQSGSGDLLTTLVSENMRWRERQINDEITDPELPRSKGLQEVNRWLADYPSEPNAYLNDSELVLQSMVKDEASAARRRDTEISHLIFELRNEDKSQYSNPGDVYFVNILFPSEKIEDDPPGRLVKLGLPAVPLLIRALDDRSFTRSERIGRVSYAMIPRVRDAAFQILEAIACKNFDYGEDFGVHMTIPSDPDPDRSLSYLHFEQNLFARRTKRIKSWWAEIQRTGEAAVLAKAVESNDRSFRYPASRLVRIDTAHAFQPIRIALEHGADSWDDAESLGKLDWKEVAECVKQQVVRGKSLSVRLTAAEIEAKHDPEPPVRAMTNELEAYIGIKHKDFDIYSSSISGVMYFLAESHRISVLPILKRTMNSSEVLRYEVISALCPDPSLSKNESSITLGASLSAADRNQFEKAAEDLLAGQLQRTEQESGRTYRLCDEACDSMARDWPEKYKMDLQGNLGQRNQYCLAALNSWRSAHQLPPLKVLH